MWLKKLFGIVEKDVSLIEKASLKELEAVKEYLVKEYNNFETKDLSALKHDANLVAALLTKVGAEIEKRVEELYAEIKAEVLK